MTTEVETPLEEQLGYKKIQRKGGLANDMSEIIETTVMDIDEVTAEDAILLGSSYLAYVAEAILHNEDRFSITVEEAVIEGYDPSDIEKSVNFERLHDKRLGLELALSGAERGDFRSVKIALRDLWEYRSTTGYADDRELALKFLQMAEIMPDFAEPFAFPAPAWLIEADLK